jgi:hypothetical protein
VLEETSDERCILCCKSNRLEETVLKENKINQSNIYFFGRQSQGRAQLDMHYTTGNVWVRHPTHTESLGQG